MVEKKDLYTIIVIIKIFVFRCFLSLLRYRRIKSFDLSSTYLLIITSTNLFQL